MKVYEPLDVPKIVAEGVWVVDGPIVTLSHAGRSIPFTTRAVVVRLADGGLWVWSPIRFSPELGARLAELGPVRHLVSPNKIHYANIAGWKTAYAEAIAWASPGVRERAAAQRVEVHFDRDLGDAPEEAWAGEMDQLVFRGSRFLDEVVFLHRASKTLIVADLIENFELEKLTFFERLLMRFGGITDPDGKASRAFRTTFFGRHVIARACIERIVAWEPERIVIAHGRWYEEDAGAELRRAFRWLR